MPDGELREPSDHQKTHDTYIVYEKRNGEAIGLAGVEEIGPGIFREARIALGPEYVGRGYGKQICEYARDGILCPGIWSQDILLFNLAVPMPRQRRWLLSCGFSYMYSEPKVRSENRKKLQT